jgi:hypothetical protein
MFGNKSRITVFTSENVFCEENDSVDIQKVKHPHRITGSIKGGAKMCRDGRAVEDCDTLTYLLGMVTWTYCSEGGERSVHSHGWWTKVRLDVSRGEKSKREVLRDEGIHWETLKKILMYSEPPGYRLREARPKPKIGPYLERIAQIIEEDKALPKKQRHTAKRLTQLARACSTRSFHHEGTKKWESQRQEPGIERSLDAANTSVRATPVTDTLFIRGAMAHA